MNTDLNTDFLQAIRYGMVDLARELVKQGVDYTMYNHRAVSEASKPEGCGSIKFLLELGEDPNRNHEQMLLRSCRYGHLDQVELLVKYSKLKNSFNVVEAAGRGHLEIVKYLIENNFPLQNETLRSAADNGHLEIVKFLVENGADVTADDNYAVRWAAYHNHLEIVKYLIEQGADAEDIVSWAEAKDKKELIDMLEGWRCER